MVDTIESAHTEQPKESTAEKPKADPHTEAHLEASAAGAARVDVERGDDAEQVLVTPGTELVPVPKTDVTPGPAAVRYAEKVVSVQEEGADSEDKKQDPQSSRIKEGEKQKKAQTQTSGSGSGKPPTGEKPTPSEEDDDGDEDKVRQEAIERYMATLGEDQHSSSDAADTDRVPPFQPSELPVIPFTPELYERLRRSIEENLQAAQGQQAETAEDEAPAETTGSDETGAVEKIEKTPKPLREVRLIEEASKLLREPIDPSLQERREALNRLARSLREPSDNKPRSEEKSQVNKQGEQPDAAETTDETQAVGMTGSGKTGAVEKALEDNTGPQSPSLIQTGDKGDIGELVRRNPNDIFAIEPVTPGLTDPDASRADMVDATVARMTEVWRITYRDDAELPDPLSTLLRKGLEELYEQHQQGSPLTMEQLREIMDAQIREYYGDPSESSMSSAIGGIITGRLSDEFMTKYEPERTVAAVPEASIISDLITTGPLAPGETVRSRAEETTQKLVLAYERLGVPISPIFMPVIQEAAIRLQQEANGPLKRPATFGRLAVLIQEELSQGNFDSYTTAVLGSTFEMGRQKLEEAAAKPAELDLPEHIDPAIENSFVPRSMGAFAAVTNGEMETPPAVIAKVARNRVEPGMLRLPTEYDENTLMNIRGLTSRPGEVMLTAGQAKDLARIGMQLIELDNHGEVQPPLNDFERSAIAHLLRSVGRRAL